MKKIFLYISFLFVATSAFAQVKVGSEGNIIATGNYPVAKSSDIKGGVHFFKTIVDRNNLPANFRDTGMIAYVNENNTYYVLIGGIANSNWQTWNTGVTVQDEIVSPGIVTWSGQGLKFYISPAIYVIGGKFYNSPLDSVTLDPAGTQSRVDLFIVDTTSRAGKITGVADGNLLTPQIDPLSQLALTQGIQINPGDTIPSSVTTKIIYDENLGIPNEWSAHTQGTISSDFNDITKPQHGLKAIHTGSYTNNSRFFFNAPSYDVITSDEVLSAWIYLTVPFTNNLYIFLYDNGTKAYSSILLSPSNGFNPNLIGQYQLISIPIYSRYWSNYSGKWDELEFIFTGTGSGGLHVDNISLQKGINNVPPQSGSDLLAYHTATQLSDTSYSLNRPNNTKTVFILESDTTGSGSTGSGVQSVSGLNTDNTDPVNPIVKISVDGTTITGDGTPANPLISHASGSGASIDSTTASNGLTLVGKDVQLGGVLTKDDTLNTGTSFSLYITGSKSNALGLLNITQTGSGNGVVSIASSNSSAIYAENGSSGNAVYAKNTSFGVAVNATNTSTGIAVNALSQSGIAGAFTSAANGIAVKAQTLYNTNGTPTVLQLIKANTGFTAANGDGLTIDIESQTSNGVIMSNQIVSKWTDINHATRTSQFVIKGVDNATTKDLLTLNGNGSVKLNQYGQNLFTGTLAKSLGVDASGNVIEYDASGGGAYTASNGLNLSGSDIQLGGTLTKNTAINNSTYALTINYSGFNYGLTISSPDGNGINATGGGSGGVFTGGAAGVTAYAPGSAIVANNTTTTNYDVGMALALQKSGSYAGSAGVGTGVIFAANNSASSLSTIGTISALFTDPNIATLTGKFVFNLDNNATADDVLAITGAGLLILIKGAPEYTDNAAAITAGLAVGTIYRTGDDLKIVH